MKANHLYFFSAFILHSFHVIESLNPPGKDGVITNCKKSGTIALTFDDGPYLYENEISTYLQKQQIKGSFFVNGNNYACIYDAAIVEKLKLTFLQGHLIGSHTWSHPHIADLNATEFTQQLVLIETALKKILGVKPKFFRPPYGQYKQQNLDILKQKGYTVLEWSFASGDADGASAKDSKKKYAKLAKNFPNPQLTLNHETIKTTSQQVIPYAVPLLIKAGYRLVSLAECLDISNKTEDLYQWVGKASPRDNSWTCEGTPAPAED